MKTVLQAIRLLEVLLFIGYVRCQDGFSEQDLLRLRQLSSNDGQIETITSYTTNLVQRDPNRNQHSLSSVSLQYQLTDEPEKNEDFQRTPQGRSDNRRKVFHIKNPFQRQLDQKSERENENFSSLDSDTGSSNQYAAMQYSLPPEEFLQQMRAESQYLRQFSTPSPSVTPQPKYQVNENPQNGYEGTQSSNQISQIESKLSDPLTYRGSSNSLQYLAPPHNYLSDNVQGNLMNQSPMQSYVSTSIPNNQYVATPSNSQQYISSAAPHSLSSAANVQQYVSSPVTFIQTDFPDYSNRGAPSGNSMNYDISDSNKKMQIDHYDNSGNGIRYPANFPQQYQNDISSTTQSPPSSTPYSETMRDHWQNALNSGSQSLSKSLQELSILNQYQNNEQQSRQESNLDNINSETNRLGNNVASANNMYMNIVQPDYQLYNTMKSRTRDLEQDLGQPDIYSHGDYGWKLAGKKSLVDNYGLGNYSPYNRQNVMPLQSDNAVAQGSYQTEHQKAPPNFVYNPHATGPDSGHLNSKTSSEHEAQEFAKAAAKAHENMKQAARVNEQYYLNNYAPSFSSNNGANNGNGQSNIVSTFYGNTDKHKTKYLTDNSNSYIYGGNPAELITGSPIYYASSRDINVDYKTNQPFDHAKALKNIVPIDVSNVVHNSEATLKSITSLDGNNRYNIPTYPKDQIEQSLKQAYRPLSDGYYKDKNMGYSFNVKSKPDDSIPEGVKQLEHNVAFYNKQHSQDLSYNQNPFSDNKRYADNTPQQINYIPQLTNSYQVNLQPPNSIQQAIQRPIQDQQDISNILKLNDIPYRLTQGLPTDSLKLHNNNFDQGSIPQPIPGRINQNVGSHQLDVNNNILNKLLFNRQVALNYNRPNEIDPQTGGLLSTIHGFRVANPFNVDLKLVAEMLKGKPAIDDTQLTSLREQYNKPLPLKLDMATLQQLLTKNDNYGSYASIGDSLSSIGNSYIDPYNSGRYPYQGGVKYSRSQEEEESILPIAESSNTHPIGAVVEQDDIPHVREIDGGSELTDQDDDDSISSSNFETHPPKNLFNIREHRLPSGPRHPNALHYSGRHSYQRKYPHKHNIGEPYPLLKPPPPQSPRNRNKSERRGRRRRIPKPKMTRIMKTEPLFKTEDKVVPSDLESPVPILLRPPAPVVEEKSDQADNEKAT